MKMTIQTRSRYCEEIAREAVAGYSGTGLETTVQYESPAEMQLAGIHEVYSVLADPVTWQAMGGAAMAIIGAEIVKDVYKKIKDLFRTMCERHKPIRGHSEVVTVRVVPEEEVAGRYERISVHYRDWSPTEDKAGSFEPQDFEKFFRHYENAICPLIDYWSSHATLRRVVVEGFLGPGEEDPRWTLHITGEDGILVHSTMNL